MHNKLAREAVKGNAVELKLGIPAPRIGCDTSMIAPSPEGEGRDEGEFECQYQCND